MTQGSDLEIVPLAALSMVLTWSFVAVERWERDPLKGNLSFPPAPKTMWTVIEWKEVKDIFWCVCSSHLILIVGTA